MSHYKPYPAYKDSGVEWLGNVPEHWVFWKLKYIARFSGGGTPSRDNLAYWNGDIPWVSPKDMKFETIVGAEESITPDGLRNSTTSLVSPGHILIVVRSGILKHTIPVAINKVEVALNQDMKAVRLNPSKCSSQFFFRWVQGFNNDLLQTWLKQGATVESIEQEYLADTIVPLPPVIEQRSIVAHLDRETTRIDALVNKKTRFIELLREKRQALITHAVTKGLDPDVKMKDSGVEWLGEVPEHWCVAPMKYVCELLKDGTHLPPPRVDEGARLLSVRNIVDGYFTERDDDSQISHDDYQDLCRAFVPLEGDVLLAVVGATLGKTAVIPKGLTNFHIQRSLAIFRPSLSRMRSGWLHLIFQSSLFQSLLWEHAGYSAQPGIYLGALASFSVPQPPVEEQVSIMNYVDMQTSRLDALISQTERSIELLKERRSALITAAVTGQIDLREAA